ncbi:MAG: ZIP family metal transporter [Nitrospinae bacterium]|nr:ZIP family metal transporter [Nitrospinota bacterium]
MTSTKFYLYLLLVAFLSIFGSLLPLFRKPEKWLLRMGISFGAGVMLATAFTKILPEISGPLGEGVGAPVLAGFLILYILEKFVMVHPCEEGDCDSHKIGPAAFLGISFHSFLDGIALGASMSLPPLTLPVFLAIVVHKVPEATSLSAILIYDGAYPRKKIWKLALMFSMTTPLGAILSTMLFKNLPDSVLYTALGFSMGTFLSIAISDLLPQVHGGDWNEKARNMAALFFGIFVIFMEKFVEPH